MDGHLMFGIRCRFVFLHGPRFHTQLLHDSGYSLFRHINSLFDERVVDFSATIKSSGLKKQLPNFLLYLTSPFMQPGIVTASLNIKPFAHLCNRVLEAVLMHKCKD
jgi:hypothetical protein